MYSLLTLNHIPFLELINISNMIPSYKNPPPWFDCKAHKWDQLRPQNKYFHSAKQIPFHLRNKWKKDFEKWQNQIRVERVRIFSISFSDRVLFHKFLFIIFIIFKIYIRQPAPWRKTLFPSTIDAMHAQWDRWKEAIVTAVMSFGSKSGKYSSYDACCFIPSTTSLDEILALLLFIYFLISENITKRK